MLWRRQIKKSTEKEDIEDDEETLKRYKKAVFETEVNLMTSISFDLDIKLATEYLKLMEAHIEAELYLNTEKCIRDFYRTPLVLYYEPHMIALASMLSASRISNCPLGKFNNRPWYQFFTDEVREQDVEKLYGLLIAVFQSTHDTS